jgi:hypothetical protein
MNTSTTMLLCLALLPWSAGCGGGSDRARDTARAGPDTVATRQQAPIDSEAVAFIPRMWMHLDSMSRWTPAQMRRMMPGHQQMARRMMQMVGPSDTMGPGRMRGGMGMGRGAPWRALRDSIESDLSTMPGLSEKELAGRRQAHIDRMRRMMVLGMGMMSGGGWASVPGACPTLDSAGRMSAEQRQRMWAMHARMATQMMDAMMANMRGHGAGPSREWTALRDSVQRDMAELPNLQGDSLRSRMRAHAERMQRLIGMQRQAMGMGMGMGMGMQMAPMGRGCRT